MTQAPPPSEPYSAQQPLSPADEKTWSILVHVGGILFSFVAPLIVYLVMKDRGPFVRHHSAQALNFQLTLLIAYVVGAILWIILIGGLVQLAAAILSLIFGILAAIAANNGQYYTYPIAIPFVK